MDLSQRMAAALIVAAAAMFLYWAIWMVIVWLWPSTNSIWILWGFLALAQIKLGWEMFRE
jgi:uncharacterized RDD family membrane protein YckC